MAQKRSYSELMKESVMLRQKQREQFVLDLYIESLLYESFLHFHSDRLKAEIDATLDRGDTEQFHAKAKEYKRLQCILRA